MIIGLREFQQKIHRVTPVPTGMSTVATISGVYSSKPSFNYNSTYIAAPGFRFDGTGYCWSSVFEFNSILSTLTLKAKTAEEVIYTGRTYTDTDWNPVDTSIYAQGSGSVSGGNVKIFRFTPPSTLSLLTTISAGTQRNDFVKWNASGDQLLVTTLNSFSIYSWNGSSLSLLATSPTDFHIIWHTEWTSDNNYILTCGQIGPLLVENLYVYSWNGVGTIANITNTTIPGVDVSHQGARWANWNESGTAIVVGGEVGTFVYSFNGLLLNLESHYPAADTRFVDGQMFNDSFLFCRNTSDFQARLVGFDNSTYSLSSISAIGGTHYYASINNTGTYGLIPYHPGSILSGYTLRVVKFI